MNQEHAAYRFSRSRSQIAVQSQQGSTHSTSAFIANAIDEGCRQQNCREFITKVIDRDVRARRPQLQDKGQVGRLAGGEHHGMADVVPQLDGDVGVDVEPITPATPSVGGDAAL
jgi:hypothetical protein